ncbi:cytochrome b5 reductase 4 [Thrips palmi]|uniref:Cytochrome b5 reductase 4 n=1 Tax=Thrips palmi TaxID=161013 RepID=A0A6P9AF57_THRPL|nr:cytochrome b5 reductase 4 [Thrips palmi]XP_034256977.1 cytochrome b5 reductase 4 [Thrips palmi]
MLSVPPSASANKERSDEAPKIQTLQQGSATGNPRNKVALAPGHSLMDWIRLGNSSQDLTGVGGRVLDVTPEQLAQHNTKGDAWLAIRGSVYNVTPYMNFHPGGVEELERGIGTDATKLFAEVHAWVNYESILKKCFVGRYRPRANGADGAAGVGVASSVAPSAASSAETSPSKAGLGMFLASKEEKEKHNAARNAPLKHPKRKLRWDWYEQEETGSIVLYCQTQEASVLVALGKDNQDFRIEVLENGETCSLHFELEGTIIWPVRIIQIPNSSKVEIQLKKMKPSHWKRLGLPCEDSGQEKGSEIQINYSKMEVVDTIDVNYNTKILVLTRLDQSFCTTPVGHHVRVRMTLEDQEVVRCYTPISKSLVDPLSTEEQTRVYLMVKEYKDGLLSSWLAGRPKQSIVEVSSPEGSFQTRHLANRKELYLFAAGTGFTPMVGVINWARKVIIGKFTKICLTFFNRTEKDILWREELDKLVLKDGRFSVTHILSEPDDMWTGLRGRIDGELLKAHLPSRSPQEDPKFFTFVCGPTAFTQLTGGLLKVLGYSDDDYHCFQG